MTYRQTQDAAVAAAKASSALARFEHHALSQPGITHIIVLEGINDIGIARQNPTPTAERSLL